MTPAQQSELTKLRAERDLHAQREEYAEAAKINARILRLKKDARKKVRPMSERSRFDDFPYPVQMLEVCEKCGGEMICRCGLTASANCWPCTHGGCLFECPKCNAALRARAHSGDAALAKAKS